MILVSLTFTLCHVLLIIHWVFYKALLEDAFSHPQGLCNKTSPRFA